MQSYRIHELHFVHLRTNHDPNSIGWLFERCLVVSESYWLDLHLAYWLVSDSVYNWKQPRVVPLSRAYFVAIVHASLQDMTSTKQATFPC